MIELIGIIRFFMVTIFDKNCVSVFKWISFKEKGYWNWL